MSSWRLWLGLGAVLNLDPEPVPHPGRVPVPSVCAALQALTESSCSINEGTPFVQGADCLFPKGKNRKPNRPSSVPLACNYLFFSVFDSSYHEKSSILREHQAALLSFEEKEYSLQSLEETSGMEFCSYGSVSAFYPITGSSHCVLCTGYIIKQFLIMA